MMLSHIEERLETERNRYELLVRLCDEPVLKKDYSEAANELRAALGIVRLAQQAVKAEILRAERNDFDD